MGLLDLNYKISRQLEEIEKEHNGDKLQKLEEKQKELKAKRRNEEIKADAIDLLIETIKNNISKVNINLYNDNIKNEIIESVCQCAAFDFKLKLNELNLVRRFLDFKYYDILAKIERIKKRKCKRESEKIKNLQKQKNNIYNIEGLGGDQIFNKLKNIL